MMGGRSRASWLAVLALSVVAIGGCIKFGATARRDDAGTPDAAKARLNASDAAPGPIAPHDPSGLAQQVAPGAPDASPPAPVDPVALAARGKVLYEKYCDFCHGKGGQGYAADEAPAIANPEFLAIASNEYLERAIANGRPGTTMSAWGVAGGGPLPPADVTAVAAYVRSWQKGPSKLVDDRVVKGDATRGAPLYEKNCARCHGANGHDGKYIALGNAELLRSASDGFLATSIEHGRPGTPMLNFSHTLSPAAIGDITALIRSWQKPTETITAFPPKPGDLSKVVINPTGPQPAFEEKADFIPVDTVKKELARGATMIIADARAPSDYVRAHIAGAVSVPFYQVDAYAPQIPKDRWILTYCACPHAASVKGRDALRALGYTKVAVLDEGILVWRDRGYPIRGGAKP